MSHRVIVIVMVNMIFISIVDVIVIDSVMVNVIVIDFISVIFNVMMMTHDETSCLIVLLLSLWLI